MALKSQWEWILKQSIERREVVEEVIGQLEQFEPQYTALNQFMVDGQEQLSKEKPIGGLPQRIREQLETCKVHFLTKWCVLMYCNCVFSCPSHLTPPTPHPGLPQRH